MPCFIFVAGASGSGKTTFATCLSQHIQTQYPQIRVSELSMDNYYKPRSAKVKTEEDLAHYRRTTNFDVPAQIDFKLFHQHLRQLAQGESIDVPVYSIPISDRTDKTTKMEPADIFIVEGIFAHHDLDKLGIAKANILTICIQADSYLTYQRRRMVREPQTRNTDAATVLAKELKYIRNAYFKFIRPAAQNHAELFFTNNHQIDENSELSNIEGAFDKDIQETVELIQARQPKLQWQSTNLNIGASLQFIMIEAALLASLIMLPISAPLQILLAAAALVTAIGYSLGESVSSSALHV